MSELGFFAVDRGIWDHPMFASRDAFSKARSMDVDDLGSRVQTASPESWSTSPEASSHTRFAISRIAGAGR
ncbi:hypothetical protein [Bradyrhizobium sp. Leo121]|uniref:hypothetical protein n=1 Tax=Bradyrhizobium sp. Leo121 TaxID=1571195 RepID=UPI00102A8A6E|nr:hypothetical protein [Bradyrhizobium sp. Leo121]